MVGARGRLCVYVWVHLFKSSTLLHCPRRLSILAFFCGSVFGVFFSYVYFFFTVTFSFFSFFSSGLHPILEISLFTNKGEKWSTPKQLCLFTACGRHFLLCFIFNALFFGVSVEGGERRANLLAAFKYTFDWELPIERILSAKTCRRDHKKGWISYSRKSARFTNWLVIRELTVFSGCYCCR